MNRNEWDCLFCKSSNLHCTETELSYIGNMANICDYCCAPKYDKEAKRMKGVIQPKPHTPFILAALQGCINYFYCKSLYMFLYFLDPGYRLKIRKYHSSMSFCSVAAKVDENLANYRTSVYTCSLLPDHGTPEKFAQFYSLDPDQQVYDLSTKFHFYRRFGYVWI